MSDAPRLAPGDWIEVGTIAGVVTQVHGTESPFDDIEIVCNSERPTLYQAKWNGEAWEFAHPMRGAYAEHEPRVAKFVDVLMGGRAR